MSTLINEDFITDTDKASAIYSWIAMNVKFDVDSYFSKKKKKRIKYKNKVDRAQKLRAQRIAIENKALNENLAVAEGYATLFKTLCDLSGIYGYIISGSGKLRTFDIGRLPRMLNHTWNVVQIGKDWYFVDAAMGAGVVDYWEKTYRHHFNDKFFFTPPEKFFLDHFPKEEGWTLLPEKTADDYANLPLFYGEYLKNDFELFEPFSGIIDVKGMDTIRFKLKSPTTLDSLSYQFNYAKEPVKTGVEKANDGYTFSIPLAARRAGYLTLFYKRVAIISFKIGTN